MAHFKKPWTYLYQMAPVLKIFVERKTNACAVDGIRQNGIHSFFTVAIFKDKIHLH